MNLLRTARCSFLGALAFAALAGTPASAADPVFPINSRLGLIPPAGFSASNRFSGFENPPANAVILLVAMPGEAYPDLEKTFTDEVLKSRGMTVVTREAMTLPNGRGVFIAGPKEADGVKRYESVLLANVAGVSAIVSVQMLESSRVTVTEPMIRDALKTLTVRASIPDAEKLAVLPYTIGNLAGFRIVRSAADGSALLTLGPKDAVADVEQPFMIIGVTGGEAPKPEERDAFARRVFTSAPGVKDIRIVRAEPLRIGQMQGYEIVAEAKDATSGVDVTTVQWLRFGQRGHLRMFAIVRRTAWNEVFPKLRAIRDNIGLR